MRIDNRPQTGYYYVSVSYTHLQITYFYKNHCNIYEIATHFPAANVTIETRVKIVFFERTNTTMAKMIEMCIRDSYARAARWDSNSPCPALCVPPGKNAPVGHF